MFAAILLLNLQSSGQAPVVAIDSINVNNINASVLSNGGMWWNGDTVNPGPRCFFPNGSRKTVGYAAALWFSGYDPAGMLHASAQTYRQRGDDYWPGPLLNGDSVDEATSQNWAKIWRISRGDIECFRRQDMHTPANTPFTILTWPARDNLYAAGRNNAPLSILTDMAPFVDLNNNGLYEPLLGEYPDIKGDLALWWVYNDHGPLHSETGGLPVGIEVRSIAWAYSVGTLLDNVVYYDYGIINRSPHTYSRFRIAQWADADLGYPGDDYVGFDSARRMGITYNGSPDDGAQAGHPPGSYGTDMPMSGVTMILLPGDAAAHPVPAGSFTAYYNDGSIIGNPINDSEYNGYMRSKCRNGQSIFAGMPDTSNCARHDTNRFYMLAGDLGLSGQCTQCFWHDHPADMRFVITTGDMPFAPESESMWLWRRW